MEPKAARPSCWHQQFKSVSTYLYHQEMRWERNKKVEMVALHRNNYLKLFKILTQKSSSVTSQTNPNSKCGVQKCATIKPNQKLAKASIVNQISSLETIPNIIQVTNPLLHSQRTLLVQVVLYFIGGSLFHKALKMAASPLITHDRHVEG